MPLVGNEREEKAESLEVKAFFLLSRNPLFKSIEHARSKKLSRVELGGGEVSPVTGYR